jgi:hypothetical protein
MDPDPNCDLQEIVIIFEKEMLIVGILLDSTVCMKRSHFS